MNVQLLGINHHTAPIELREALAIDGATVQALLREIRSNAAVCEAAIIATCNRTELYVSGDDSIAAEAAMRQMFARQAGNLCSLVDSHAYLRSGGDACRHLLRVAAGLDSMILGEHQILGQVREAQGLAKDAETLGPLMQRLWSAAIHTGKRARAETDIGMGAVSIASATVSLAERVLGDLRDRAVLLIGAGDTCRLAARHLADRRPGRLLVANRTLARGTTVAEAFGGNAVPLGDIPSLLGSVDVVVSATRAPGFVVTSEMVRNALSVRGPRSLVLVDVAVPRDIEPSAADLENVFLYSIDAIRTLVDRSLAHRLRQVPRVEAIVEEECGKLMAWARGQGAATVVRELVDRFERVRAEEVRRNLKHFHPEEQAYIDRLTRTLVSRLLRPPITQLTSGTLTPSLESARLELVRELFALEPAASAIEVDRGTP
jgi:glutamyl-tRNA reductase